jgi:hypothetical protein
VDDKGYYFLTQRDSKEIILDVIKDCSSKPLFGRKAEGIIILNHE